MAVDATIKGAPAAEIVFSDNQSRTDPVPLDVDLQVGDVSITGVIYVFIDPASDVTSVEWWKDLTGPYATRNGSPFDLEGTSGGNPIGLDVDTLDRGTHTWWAIITTSSGDRFTLSARFRAGTTVDQEDSVDVALSVPAASVQVTSQTNAAPTVTAVTVDLTAPRPAVDTGSGSGAETNLVGWWPTIKKGATFYRQAILDIQSDMEGGATVRVLQSDGGQASWAAFEGAGAQAPNMIGWSGWRTDHAMTWRTPPWPPSTGNQIFQQVIDGNFDTHYRNRARFLRDNGFVDGDRRAIEILMWEFNGRWYKWSANDGGAARHQQFIDCWRRIVDVMRSVEPAIEFGWCPSNPRMADGNNASVCWPGDDYVDLIGLDFHDRDLTASRQGPPAAEDPPLQWQIDRWDHMVVQQLGWLEDFSQDIANWTSFTAGTGTETRGVVKQMFFGEWSLWDESETYGQSTPNKWGGGRDNPYYIEKFWDWIQGRNVWSAIYFNSRNLEGEGDHQITDAAAFPLANAKYKTTWGTR